MVHDRDYYDCINSFKMCIFNSCCLKLCIVLCLCPVSSPRRFRAKLLSPTKLQVAWKEPKGEFESYKVIYTTQPGKRRRSRISEMWSHLSVGLDSPRAVSFHQWCIYLQDKERTVFTAGFVFCKRVLSKSYKQVELSFDELIACSSSSRFDFNQDPDEGLMVLWLRALCGKYLMWPYIILLLVSPRIRRS